MAVYAALFYITIGEKSEKDKNNKFVLTPLYKLILEQIPDVLNSVHSCFTGFAALAQSLNQYILISN